MLLASHKEEMEKGRELVEQLKQQLSDKDGVINKQAAKITELTAANATLQNDASFYEVASKKYWHAMGVIRRWLYLRKQQ